MAQVLIAFGSNIDPEQNLPRALKLLARHVPVQAVSTVYRTAPVGRPEQDPFYNGAALVETDISPRDLKFSVLRGIEQALGRRRTADRYAARTIDLDIALYGDLVVDEPDLQIPDPDIPRRPFLSVPLAELAPQMKMSGTDLTLSDLAAQHGREGMTALGGFTAQLRRQVTDEPGTR